MNILETKLSEAQLALSNLFARYEASREVIDPVIEELAPMTTMISFLDSIDIGFMGDAALLARVIRVLRTHGWDYPKREDDTKKLEWYSFFDHPESKIRIWVSFTSTVCRRVKVGTKLVEEDVFEIKCEG